MHICAQHAHSHRIFALLDYVGPDDHMLSIKDKDGKSSLDLAMENFELAKRKGSATLGLKWQEAKQEEARVIANDALAALLQQRSHLTPEELAQYHVDDEYYGRVIRVGDRYLKPVASKKFRQYTEVIERLRKTSRLSEGGLDS